MQLMLLRSKHSHSLASVAMRSLGTSLALKALAGGGGHTRRDAFNAMSNDWLRTVSYTHLTLPTILLV
eukprot:342468-Amphidinium_carterae.1